MTTTEELHAFVCTVCPRTVKVAHIPPATPQCPSCGADTRPNEAMVKKAGNVRCAHCGLVEPAYQHERCPNCDTVFQTFATRAEQPPVQEPIA